MKSKKESVNSKNSSDESNKKEKESRKIKRFMGQHQADQHLHYRGLRRVREKGEENIPHLED